MYIYTLQYLSICCREKKERIIFQDARHDDAVADFIIAAVIFRLPKTERISSR